MSARVARTGLRAAQQFSVARPAFNGLRTYATPAQDSRPPVALFGVDGTYATALVCIRPFARYSSSLVEIFRDTVLPRPLPLPPLRQSRSWTSQEQTHPDITTILTVTLHSTPPPPSPLLSTRPPRPSPTSARP